MIRNPAEQVSEPLDAIYRAESRRILATLIRLLGCACFADWPQFRGPGALGRGEAKGVPLHWNDTLNLVWKAALPGPGASSPITVGDRVFATCFAGFATSSREPGAGPRLLLRSNRALYCIDR